MIKQARTLGYVSISGRKIAAILLILICSFAAAWATHSGRDASVKPVQQSLAHTNHGSTGGRPVSPATHNHSKTADKAHTHHGQGALSTFKAHVKKSSRVRQSTGAGQGANQGFGGGTGGGSASVADQGAGQGAKPKSDETPSPTPEESPGPTSDATLGSSPTMTGTSRWPRAAATPAGLTDTSRWPRAAATPMPSP